MSAFLSQLQTLGFSDRKANLTALQESSGIVEGAVDVLARRAIKQLRQWEKAEAGTHFQWRWLPPLALPRPRRHSICLAGEHPTRPVHRASQTINDSDSEWTADCRLTWPGGRVSQRRH